MKLLKVMALFFCAATAQASIIYNYELSFASSYSRPPPDFFTPTHPNPCQPLCTGIAHSTIRLSDTYVFGTPLTKANVAQYFESIFYNDGIETIFLGSTFVTDISGIFTASGGSIFISRNSGAQDYSDFGGAAALPLKNSALLTGDTYQISGCCLSPSCQSLTLWLCSLLV